jgi:chemotaxis-related protein WspD
MTPTTVQPGSDSCWSVIGSTGDRSCPRLEQARHCRHCEVYTGAATRVMRRPIDQNQRNAWAEELRQPEEQGQATDQSALSFRLGGEWLMLAAPLVASVAPLAPVHRLPHRSGGALLGVVNVDGMLTPAIDLAQVLGIERGLPATGGRHVFPRLLVLTWHEQTFAVPADEVDGVVRYRADELSAPPSSGTSTPGLVRAMLARADHHYGLLDGSALGDTLWRLLR